MRNANFFELNLNCEGPDKCCSMPTRDKRITLDDNEGSTSLEIDNVTREDVYKIKVDGCLYKSPQEGKRCDWALYSHQHNKLILVELKSSWEVAKCIAQFIETANFFNAPNITCCVLVYISWKIQSIQKKLAAEGLKFLPLKANKMNRTYEIPLAELLHYREDDREAAE